MPPARLAYDLSRIDFGRALMQRAFDVDVLARPGCSGRLRLIATGTDPHVIHEILAHLGLSPEVPHPDPRQPPPADAGSLLIEVLS